MGLRDDCLAWLEGSSAEYFDDFLRADEFDLALHVVCDLVIEESIMTSEHIVASIDELHQLMVIHDDCVTKIRKRLAE
jgi:hypothetical protein